MAKKKNKTLSKIKAEAYSALQQLVRLKAADSNGLCTCVTCGVVLQWNRGMQGGHFIPKKLSSKWALVEENVHPQCRGCNGYGMRYGDAAQRYTVYMLDMYGREAVDKMLATRHEAVKFKREDLENMIEEYKQQIETQKQRIGG